MLDRVRLKVPQHEKQINPPPPVFRSIVGVGQVWAKLCPYSRWLLGNSRQAN